MNNSLFSVSSFNLFVCRKRVCKDEKFVLLGPALLSPFWRTDFWCGQCLRLVPSIELGAFCSDTKFSIGTSEDH